MSQTDNAEHVNEAFQNFLELSRIKRQLTVSYSPQQNGVAERVNRTLVEMARSLLLHSGLDESFWSVKTALYIRNGTVTNKLIDTTPIEC